MTRAELNAQAEALEWALDNLVPSGFARLRQMIDERSDYLRAQAAAVEAQESEPVAFGLFVGLRHMPAGTTEFYGYLYGDAPNDKCDLYLRPDPRIAEYRELLLDAEQGLRVLKTMLKIEHLPGGAAAAEQLIERIRAALEKP